MSAASISSSDSSASCSLEGAVTTARTGVAFKHNAAERKQERVNQLAKLSSVTSSKAYREDEDAAEQSPRSVAIETLELMFKDAALDRSELTFVKRLGEGGFATVDLYERQVNAKRLKVAVKVMKDKMVAPPLNPYDEPKIVSVPASERLKFKAEAVLLKALKHPHVVACFGVLDGELDGKGEVGPPMLVQEFCPGGTLLDKIKKPQSYSASEALRWLRDTAAGMEYLHSYGGTHRDLKPENVLLSVDGKAKVADFGLFRMEGSGDHGEGCAATSTGIHVQVTRRPSTAARISEMSAERSDKEVTGCTGSCRYMAPECFRQGQGGDKPQTYTNKVDVFSFAILAYEVLRRKRAYEEKLLTMEQVAKAVHQSGLRPSVPPNWPSEVSALLERCWAAEPTDRPEFGQVVKDLDALLKAADEGEDSDSPASLLDALENRGSRGSRVSASVSSAGCCIVS